MNDLGKSKYFANRGIARNKKPLPNIIYKIEIVNLKDGSDKNYFDKFKFKDLGYLTMAYSKDKADKFGEHIFYWNGFITIDELKSLIGTNQYSKFCQGKREFIIQRRINGNNISINKNNE